MKLQTHSYYIAKNHNTVIPRIHYIWTYYVITYVRAPHIWSHLRNTLLWALSWKTSLGRLCYACFKEVLVTFPNGMEWCPVKGGSTVPILITMMVYTIIIVIIIDPELSIPFNDHLEHEVVSHDKCLPYPPRVQCPLQPSLYPFTMYSLTSLHVPFNILFSPVWTPVYRLSQFMLGTWQAKPFSLRLKQTQRMCGMR